MERHWAKGLQLVEWAPPSFSLGTQSIGKSVDSQSVGRSFELKTQFCGAKI